MTSMKISDAAEATGFSADTLRYYERIGLVEASARTDAGYRLYDSDDIETLEFVGHAKAAGLSLDHIGELVELRRSGDCGPVRDRLHDLVCARAGSARAQSAELSEFAVRLDELGSRLASSTITSRCGPSCACTTPLPKSAGQLPTVLSEACTLPESDIPDRLAAWRHLFATAQRVDVTEHGHTVVLPPGPAVAVRAAELAALEHDCCGPALRFTVEPTADAVFLHFSGPGAAEALSLFAATS